jgi:hypothetical protein
MRDFDPYHKWLGIPRSEQPANHYRLLGIPLYEKDTDVIQAAADQRMAFVQSCATGEHMAKSQEVLNSLARARTCLLDPDRRRQYDAGLKAHAASPWTAAQDVPALSRPAGPVASSPSVAIADAFRDHAYRTVIELALQLPEANRTPRERDRLRIAQQRLDECLCIARELELPPSDQRKLRLFELVGALHRACPDWPEATTLVNRYCEKYSIEPLAFEQPIPPLGRSRWAAGAGGHSWRAAVLLMVLGALAAVILYGRSGP